MSSSKEYIHFILEQLSELEEIACRPMMGEYLLYYRGKLAGGIYDDRLLLKPVPAARAMMPNAPWEIPYKGAKPMLLADNLEDKAFLAELLQAMYSELPAPKPKKKKQPKAAAPEK